MAQHFEGEEFHSFARLIPEGWDGATFVRCRAQSVTIGTVSDALKFGRSTICNVTDRQCVANSLCIGPLILKDCHFDRLTTSRHAAVFEGTVFENCRFTGRCGRIHLKDCRESVGSFIERNERIVAHNDALYKNVKSAIDISTATFTEFQAWGVPGELFKVNGVDQFVVDFNATESFLRSQSIPNDGPLTMLQLIHDRRRDFRYNYVHVIPRTRSDGLLECWNAIADILRTHDLLTTPDHS